MVLGNVSCGPGIIRGLSGLSSPWSQSSSRSPLLLVYFLFQLNAAHIPAAESLHRPLRIEWSEKGFHTFRMMAVGRHRGRLPENGDAQDMSFSISPPICCHMIGPFLVVQQVLDHKRYSATIEHGPSLGLNNLERARLWTPPIPPLDRPSNQRALKRPRRPHAHRTHHGNRI